MLTDYDIYAEEIRGSGSGSYLACDGNNCTPRECVDPETAVSGRNFKRPEILFCGFGYGAQDYDGGQITCRGGRYIDEMYEIRRAGNRRDI